MPVNILRCRDKRQHNPQLSILSIERFPLANFRMTSTAANDVIQEGIDDRRSLIRGQCPVVSQTSIILFLQILPLVFPPSILYNVKNLISINKMYVTLKLDDNGCCRIHSVSDDGNGWIVTDESMWLCPGRCGYQTGQKHDPRRGG